MLNVLLTKKNAQLLSAFHIIHFTASTLRDTGYLVNTYIQSPFLQPHDFDFSHIFFHGAPQIVLAYIRQECGHFWPHFLLPPSVSLKLTHASSFPVPWGSSYRVTQSIYKTYFKSLLMKLYLHVATGLCWERQIMKKRTLHRGVGKVTQKAPSNLTKWFRAKRDMGRASC